MLRHAPLLALAALALIACQKPAGEDLPSEWTHVGVGMTQTEVEGLVGRKADQETATTGRRGLTWRSRTHQLNVTFEGGKVKEAHIRDNEH